MSRPRPPRPDPDEDRRFGAADEPFWREQEARLSGQLGQPCCTLSGMCTLLGSMRGDFVVVIHGERDCGNSFVHHRMVAAERFFSTGLTEDQVTTGRVDEPLERCLRLLLDEVAPEVVIVLTTCPVTLIGADPGPVVQRVARDTDTPMLVLRTDGLKLLSQAEMADWLYASLAGLPPLPPDDTRWRPRAASVLQQASASLQSGRSVDPDELRARVEEALTEPPPDRCANLIGLPPDLVDDGELSTALQAVEVQVTGLYPFAADLRGWRTLSSAAVNVVADRTLYPRLLDHLEQAHHMATLEVPLPIGLGQSLRFYEAVGHHFGVREELLAALSERIDDARAQVDSFRGQARGLRVAMGLRMLNNYQADQLAYDGLGDVEALAELGFDLTLLVQGPPEEQPRFEQRLAELGVDRPLHVFPSPWDLAPLLRAGDYQVAYLADHSLEEAQKAGVPMIKSRTLAPLLGGVARNLEVLGELLRVAAAGVGGPP